MNRRKLLLMGKNSCGKAAQDAIAYANRIGADQAFKDYVSNMMLDLCYKGIYTKFEAMYLLAGGTANTVSKEFFTDARNLEYLDANGNPGTGGLDFSNGLKGDGTHYANTNYTATKHSAAGHSYFHQTHFILSDEGSSSGCVYGNNSHAYNADYFRLFSSEIWVKKSYETRLFKISESGSKLGIYTVSNEDGEIKIFKNGQLYASREHSPGYQASFEDYYLLAENHKNVDAGRYQSNSELQFWGTSKKLSYLQIQQLHASLADLQDFIRDVVVTPPATLNITTFQRTSNTTYQIQGTGSGTIYKKDLDTNAITQVTHDFASGAYTLTHNAGERFEVSTDQTNWVYDNKIRYVEYLQSGRDNAGGNTRFTLFELQAISTGSNVIQNKPISTVGSVSVVQPLANMVDGDTGTYGLVESSPTGGVRVDIGQDTNVDQIKFLSSNSVNYNLLNLRIICEKANGARSTIINAASTPNNAGSFNTYNVKI